MQVTSLWQTARTPKARSGAWARWLLRAVWLGLTPLALAALCQHFLLPSAYEAQGPLSALMWRFGNEQPLLVFVGLFVAFSTLLRYWQRYLPGLSAAAARRNESPRAREHWSSLLGVAIAVVATLAVRSSVLEPYRVLTGSMLPMLEPGDWLLANKLAYGYHLPLLSTRFAVRAPKRGDVIAFNTPPDAGAGLPERLVKRVVGLPGDRIHVRNGYLWINNWPVPSCEAGIYAYLSADSGVRGRLVVEFLENQAYLTVFFPGGEPFPGYVVKPGEVFVLGDNRDNSSDSRAWNNHSGAGLPLESIEGRVSMVLLGSARDGSVNWQKVLRRLRPALRSEGMDMTAVQNEIDRCLQNRPSETTPPKPW